MDTIIEIIETSNYINNFTSKTEGTIYLCFLVLYVVIFAVTRFNYIANRYFAQFNFLFFVGSFFGLFLFGDSTHFLMWNIFSFFTNTVLLTYVVFGKIGILIYLVLFCYRPLFFWHSNCNNINVRRY
jgi:hypothetical protein